jgi:hypothetical protein
VGRYKLIDNFILKKDGKYLNHEEIISISNLEDSMNESIT